MNSRNSSKITAAVADIKRRYKMGAEILKKCPSRHASGVVLGVAEDLGIDRNTALKLRVLADPDTGYSRAELQELCDRFQQEGHALTFSHLVKIISVPRGRRRTDLTNQAIKHRWSSHELQAKILEAQGRRKQGGRRPTIADSRSVKSRLQQQLFSWGRWLDMHQEVLEGCGEELTSKTTKLRKIIRAISAELTNAVDERGNQTSGQRRGKGNAD